MQPRGIGKDALLLLNLSLNCSCTLQRDWGMNPGPGSFNKVIKIFQDWLGKLHLKFPTTQADVLSHHTAYLEVGSWVSFPPCFEKSLFHPKEHEGIYMSDLEGECCLLPGHSVRPGKAVFHQICFSLAGSPKYRNCIPETLREACRSWKLKALFTFPVQLAETNNPQAPWQYLAHSSLLKPDGKHSMLHQQRCLCLCGWQWGPGRCSAATLNRELVLLCMSLNTPLHSRKPLLCLCVYPPKPLTPPVPFSFSSPCHNIPCFTTLQAEESWTTTSRQVLKTTLTKSFYRIKDFQMLSLWKVTRNMARGYLCTSSGKRLEKPQR